ncbi:DUF2283 domain-containing protein [Archangium minus]|uniref:DUF2283 domain-containing protein n=1 Tax=Archangium minus TaxID=83450 RepID=A0ABY9XB34_9BACT|nr:DUF2283 domain-containing protein [Archangium violaceum]WNG52561.1 DUF2283 domain-containing protein [Archangium minus]
MQDVEVNQAGRTHELVRGPEVVLDFDQDGILVGIELLA